MRNPSKREIPHEKNKKNSARFPDNERYFHHFQEAKRPPRFQIISFLRQDEGGAKNQPLSHPRPSTDFWSRKAA